MSEAQRRARIFAPAILCAALLAGCDAFKPPPFSVSDYERAMKECLAAVPVGPQQTTYNDWSEVVSECRSYAHAVALLIHLEAPQ